MSKGMFIYYIGLCLRAVLGVVFLVAAIGKISDPLAFLSEIHNYDMLPDFLERILALWIPWMEMVSAVLLLFGSRVRANAGIISLLLIIFTMGVAIAWGRGLEINCGCFGDMAEQKVGLAKIIENTLLLAGSLFLFLWGDKNPSENHSA